MEYHPDHQRTPSVLSPEQVREALTELDTKLDTLRRRARATAADSPHTYHAHIATLERKRTLLGERATAAQGAGHDAQQASSLWSEFKSGVDVLRQDLKELLD